MLLRSGVKIVGGISVNDLNPAISVRRFAETAGLNGPSGFEEGDLCTDPENGLGRHDYISNDGQMHQLSLACPNETPETSNQFRTL